MRKNIYEQHTDLGDEDSVVSGDTVIYIDANSNNTLMDDIKSIRNLISNVESGDTVSIYITYSGTNTNRVLYSKSLYWRVLFSYVDQVSKESKVGVDVVFRGCILFDMLDVFRYTDISVFVSESCVLMYTSCSVLLYLSWYPENIDIIIKQFPALFCGNCIDKPLVELNGVNLLQKLKHNFETY